MKRAASLCDMRVLQHQMPAGQFGEVRNAAAEQHRHQADVHLIDQSEVERLLGDGSAGNRGILAIGDLPGTGDGRFDPFDERRPRPTHGSVSGGLVSDNHHRCPNRVMVVPAAGDVEQPPAGNQRSGAGDSLGPCLRVGLVETD